MEHMNLRQLASHLIRAYRISPKKRLGQHFMVDEYLLQLLVSHADLKQTDVVLEVGAGFGFLTRKLAEKSDRVLAVEADPNLIGVLRRELAGLDNVQIIVGDFLKAAIPPFDKVVCNPPFSISSPLLFRILERAFDSAVMTFQREFARRLNAPVGSKDYSRLTVSTFYRAQVELLEAVPKEAFYPPPNVEAFIVKLTPRRLRPFEVKSEEIFAEVLRVLFSQRNRKARKTILPLLEKFKLENTVVLKIGQLPFLNKRVRELTPADFGALANEISA